VLQYVLCYTEHTGVTLTLFFYVLLPHCVTWLISFLAARTVTTHQATTGVAHVKQKQKVVLKIPVYLQLQSIINVFPLWQQRPLASSYVNLLPSNIGL